eukprot:g7502.t1
MVVLPLRIRFSRSFLRRRHAFHFRRRFPQRKRRYTNRVKTASLSRRIPRTLRAHENGNESYIELSLFKELETELASLGDALVKIQESRVVEGQDDETILSTLIEEVQREQEAWFQQVQVMERLVAEAGTTLSTRLDLEPRRLNVATIESNEVEVDELRRSYDELRKKVELYNALLNEREREVDSLKQQLMDVNTAVEVNELKRTTTTSLKELVATDGELRLPHWSTNSTSSLFSETTDGDRDVEIPPNDKETRIVPVKSRYKIDVNKMEVPGLALVSVIALLGDGAGGAYDLATARMPKRVKAIMEIAMLCALLGTGAVFATIPFL